MEMLQELLGCRTLRVLCLGGTTPVPSAQRSPQGWQYLYFHALNSRLKEWSYFGEGAAAQETVEEKKLWRLPQWCHCLAPD